MLRVKTLSQSQYRTQTLICTSLHLLYFRFHRFYWPEITDIIIIIISRTHTGPPACWGSCAAAAGRDATPGSPASCRSCLAAGAASSSWTRTRPPWSGSGTGPAGRCPRRDGGPGGPPLGRKPPRGTTGPPPGARGPGRRWVKLGGRGGGGRGGYCHFTGTSIC